MKRLLIPLLLLFSTSTFAQTAVYYKTDINHNGVYGTDGSLVALKPNKPPAYATVSEVGGSSWRWADGVTTWTAWPVPAGPSFTLNVNITDGLTHQVAVLANDDDNLGRAESIQVLNATTGALLSSQQASNFVGGTYFIWYISGSVKFVVTYNGKLGGDAVVTGLFFDLVPGNPPPITLHYVSISWTPVNGMTYKIRRNDGMTFTSPTSPYRDGSVMSGVYYSYTVAAINSNGQESVPTQVITFGIP